MARYLLVLKPRGPVDAPQLIAGLEPLITHLDAVVDHRTSAHLSAVVRSGADNLCLQLFADVQAKRDGTLLELVLMSGEAMGRGAPQTRQCFEELVKLASSSLPDLDLVFRSDRDGPLP